MIAVFTDFGHSGPYMGQMRAVLHREAPGVAVVDLMADAPAFRVRAAAYILASLAPQFAAGDVLLCVVDPGVGGTREAVAVRVDELWLVGPDNGLFEALLRRARAIDGYRIAWRPPHLSDGFHGRDLFAPVAARLARGDSPAGAGLVPHGVTRHGRWPDDLAEVVYVDRYGNLVTGLRAAGVARDAILKVAGRRLEYARTFCEVATGAAFWYENANGLVEVAANAASAAALFEAGVGTPVEVETPTAGAGA